MSSVKQCPRCGEHHLEVFRSHEYCANCNYGICFVKGTLERVEPIEERKNFFNLNSVTNQRQQKLYQMK